MIWALGFSSPRQKLNLRAISTETKALEKAPSDIIFLKMPHKILGSFLDGSLAIFTYFRSQCLAHILGLIFLGVHILGLTYWGSYIGAHIFWGSHFGVILGWMPRSLVVRYLPSSDFTPSSGGFLRTSLNITLFCQIWNWKASCTE